MKGLLIKDLKLLKMQRSYFLLIVAIAVGMVLFRNDITFPLGFLTFVASLFVISTISYDEFDNGNAFLFTLPITRTTYVKEKYALGLLLGGGAWTLITLIIMIVGQVKNIVGVNEVLYAALSILPIVILIQAIMIPFQLKFGGEKARIALLGAFGIIFLLGFLVLKIFEMLNVDLLSVLNTLPDMSMKMALGILILVALILLAISMKISIRIMKKKEF